MMIVFISLSHRTDIFRGFHRVRNTQYSPIKVSVYRVFDHRHEAIWLRIQLRRWRFVLQSEYGRPHVTVGPSECDRSWYVTPESMEHRLLYYWLMNEWICHLEEYKDSNLYIVRLSLQVKMKKRSFIILRKIFTDRGYLTRHWSIQHHYYIYQTI